MLLLKNAPVALEPQNRGRLAGRLGISDAGQAFAPEALFGAQAWSNPTSLLALLLGGLLVGLERWANGCTSGHAISGLSSLQWTSLMR